MQSAAQARSFEKRRSRLLAGASFLMVGLAIGNWPTNVQAQALPSMGTHGAAVAGVIQSID
jgi:hypothetical protein